MKKATTSIKVDPELWKRAKKYSIDKDMTVSDLIERLLKKELGNME